jgi:hypothetical protein
MFITGLSTISDDVIGESGAEMAGAAWATTGVMVVAVAMAQAATPIWNLVLTPDNFVATEVISPPFPVSSVAVQILAD